MAKEFISDNSREGIVSHVVFSRKEAADVIGQLVALLADVPLINNHAGAIPEVRIQEFWVTGRGLVQKKIFFTIE